jgi:arabinogalactan endo-1,4-beta-galactosidase
MLGTTLALVLASASNEEIRGVDASFLPQLADLGVAFYEGGKARDPLASFRDRGINWLRLRVWVHPKNGYCGVPKTLKLSRAAKKLGYKLLINFHYSDDWGDPQHQIAPKAWAKFTVPESANAVYWHTRATLEKLDRQGTPADMVQIGNEVRDGLFYPTCQISQSGWKPFVEVLRAGVRAVRGAKLSKRPLISMHYDRGGRPKECMAFFSKLREFNLDYDVLQLSYYPWWHGPMEDLERNLASLAKAFRKPIFVGETAYPFTLGWNDRVGNFVGQQDQLVPGLAATPEGQAEFLRRLRQIVRQTPKGLGWGVMYWAPEYVAVPGFGSPYENLALFDFDRKLLPGAAALGGPLP